MLNEELYLKRRADSWRRLETLCLAAETSPRNLSGNEIVEFVRLYRMASGDLAYLVTHSSNADVVAYLNALVTRAYAALYTDRTPPLQKLLADSLAVSARTVRKHVWPILAAALVFLGGTAWSATILATRPDARAYFIQPGWEENFEAWKTGEFEQRTTDDSLLMTGFYASNNPRVALMTIGVAAGTAGVGSTFILWQNGLLVGALAQEMAAVGKLGFLLSSIGPHGVSEVGGIFVVGGAGYVLAIAILRPGRRKWSDALRHAGKDAFVLAVTALVMIFLAAPIEGFFSFNPNVPQPLKVAFTAVALLAWGAFFVGYAREPNSDTASTLPSTRKSTLLPRRKRPAPVRIPE